MYLVNFITTSMERIDNFKAWRWDDKSLETVFAFTNWVFRALYRKTRVNPSYKESLFEGRLKKDNSV